MMLWMDVLISICKRGVIEVVNLNAFLSDFFSPFPHTIYVSEAIVFVLLYIYIYICFIFTFVVLLHTC